MRRVVVTGMGLVSPLGSDLEAAWQDLLAGKSGLRAIEHLDVSDLPAKIAGLVPRADRGHVHAHLYDPGIILEEKEQRRTSDFVMYGMVAAHKAISDSGWLPQDEASQKRTGVLIGSGIGGLDVIYENSTILNDKGPRRISPFFIPASLINLCAGQVSIKYGFRGPNHSVVTACATGAHAIGDAARIIRYGQADVMVAGGTEAAVCRLGIAGFAAARALSTSYNDRPSEASRPWDKDRDGFVMGEGAGVLVLEEYEHAKKRGAKIYAEIKGYGLSGDAYHITSPAEDGHGAKDAMRMALEDAGLDTALVGYINAHGTSTPMGDGLEHSAVKEVFASSLSNLKMSSTKSAIGHLLGAAGSVEAIFSILAMRDSVVPPTLNLHTVSEGLDGINLVPLVAQEASLQAVMSNSFGFGGTNASLIMTKI